MNTFQINVVCYKITQKSLFFFQLWVGSCILFNLSFDKKLFSRAKKKKSCLRKLAGWKIFYHLPTHIVKCVSEYIFFCFIQKKHTQTKSKRNLRKLKKKKPKKKMRKKMLNVVNSICGKSIRIQWYHLRICCLHI